jgi:hypothetical protein
LALVAVAVALEKLPPVTMLVEAVEVEVGILK